MTAALRAVTEADLDSCFPLMRQLRPHLTSAADFRDRWRRQSAEGYRLVALWERDGPIALAGYRVTENLVHGRFLYVDDLVTRADCRRGGLGARLLDHLKAEGRARHCAKLVLDTDLGNGLAHRFYYRQGLLAAALRFNQAL
jgi:ribosomal protein S18 acetylase RimI-like enzyme